MVTGFWKKVLGTRLERDVVIIGVIPFCFWRFQLPHVLRGKSFLKTFKAEFILAALLDQLDEAFLT